MRKIGVMNTPKSLVGISCRRHYEGSARGHQYPAAGAQGLPLLQGWVAKAPTRGSRWQIPFPTVRMAMLASSIAAYAFCARAVDAAADAGAPPLSTSSFG